MSSPLGGAKDATATGQLGVDGVDRGGNTPVPRGVRGASNSSQQPVGPAIDRRGDDAQRRTLAERHARLLDNFITDYASETGRKASDGSVRKVINATVSLFERDPDAQALFNPRDDRGWLARRFTSAPQTDPGKLDPRQHKGVGTVRDFTTALGDRAAGRIAHFHEAIKANPGLLKTRMRYGLFLLRTRSTREQRQQMRAIAAGLLLCGLDRHTVAYAMQAMRAAINKDDSSDAKLAQAYSAMQQFIKGGGANDDPANMVAHGSGLQPVLTFLRRTGRGRVQGDLPVSLRKPSRPKAAKPDAPERSKPPKTTSGAPQNQPSSTNRGARQSQLPRTRRAPRNEPASSSAPPPAGPVKPPTAKPPARPNEARDVPLDDVVLGTQIDDLGKAAAAVATNEVGAHPNYVERQFRELCGKHAINAYLQGNVISARSMSAFLKLSQFWLNPHLDEIADNALVDATAGNEFDTPHTYLNWLNGKGLLGPDQRPLVATRYNQSNVQELSRDPPRDSHMMFYQGQGAHFVTFHPREQGRFALYDSVSQKPQESIDPVEFAKAKISGESDLNLAKHMFGVDLRANTVVVARPARGGFETRRALALPMTIDKIRDLDGARMTLLKKFLEVATDPAENGALDAPAAQPEADEKHAVVTDETASGVQQGQDQQADSKLGRLSADFPKLAGLARRVGAMEIEAGAMPEERAAMRAVVDEAFQQIAPMQRDEQLRLFIDLGVYTEAQARQNNVEDHADRVVRQYWPWADEDIRKAITGAVRDDFNKKEQGQPRGLVLDREDRIAIEQLTISSAHDEFQLELPPQAMDAANDLQTGGPAPPQRGPEPDVTDDEKLTQ